MGKFRLVSEFEPRGDQPQAIDSLVERIQHGETHQVLLGVTGSGKTFTLANVIAQVQKPTLVVVHNKTLAAQLYREFQGFFPDNAVGTRQLLRLLQPAAIFPLQTLYRKDLRS